MLFINDIFVYSTNMKFLILNYWKLIKKNIILRIKDFPSFRLNLLFENVHFVADRILQTAQALAQRASNYP